MKTFEEYMTDWWLRYLSEASEETQKALMENIIGEEETIDDYIPGDADTPYNWLVDNMTADEIFAKYFGHGNTGGCPDNMPDSSEFIYQMLKENASWVDGDTSVLPSFAEEYLRDMVDHIENYDNPLGFFEDFQRGGCSSGMIGMLIYNYDCKRIYIEHIDDMEDYVEQMREEFGCIKNEDNLPHYTFVCWVCYEEFALQIGRTLFPVIF